MKGAKNFWLELYRDECEHCRGTGKVVCKHCHGTKDLRRGVGVLDHAKLQITENPGMQYDFSKFSAFFCSGQQALACMHMSRSLDVITALPYGVYGQQIELKPDPTYASPTCGLGLLHALQRPSPQDEPIWQVAGWSNDGMLCTINCNRRCRH